MQSRRMPCKARSVPNNHNAETAFFEIPSDIEHGQILICSHPQCASSGRRFRFCKFCDIPVAKRNFARRHSHGQVPPSTKDEDDEDSVNASKKARTDDASATPTELDYDQRSTPSFDGKDKNDRGRTFEHENMRSSPTQPMGPFDMTVASSPSIQPRNRHFETSSSGERGSPMSYCGEVEKVQPQQKNDPYRHHRPRWEESPMAESPVPSQHAGMHSRPNQMQQGWDVPQSKVPVFRQKQSPPFPVQDYRQSVHRGRRTPYHEKEPSPSSRGGERKRASDASFNFGQSQQRTKQPIESATTVMHLSSTECHWLRLLHSRPPTSDVEAMRKWMDNVISLSAVPAPTSVSSPPMPPPEMHQRHHSEVSVETPPSESYHQGDLGMQRAPQTPPPPSRSHGIRHVPVGSRDVSPIMGRQIPPEAETNYHTSASTQSYESPYISRGYGNENNMQPYY